ncbi:autoinducer binding domain-containing protein [Maritimibacter sp. UBA3975]|uniref:autoinducer binding domain-containing protein n=1 Tax=Maritimibacter sp. UBA3975 TaxID=1946833 RepID=UPI000C0A4419|nr:autoinducer binding domain-containing protein [Maritimibacter sp. UBA3975]MAM59895.1 LuxR family transcriptional regulator [Maritimibacter sp.]|tara:strand:+ start:13621 stop:14232 length:612 start_codon:yes stop_codon:yes gene_type:complete
MGRNQIIDDLLIELGEQAPAGYFLALHIRFAAPLMMFQTYNPAWTDHYSRNAYALRDPMVAWGIATTGATRWSDIDLPDPFAIMDEASTFGLVYGICISCGPMTSRTVAGVARGDREFDDEEMSEITGTVLRLHHETQPPDQLTPAEKEALHVIASGDRYAAGAARLGISESALKARLAAARGKLFARTTAEALQRAKDYRLI